FADLDALGVLGDVLGGGGDAGAFLQADHACLVQQQQGAAAVGGVVGDHHGGAVGQVVQRLVLAGVGAEGFDVHAGHADQLGALALVELIEVRLVLEEVGVQALLGDLNVGLHVVGEDLHLEVDALFGQRRLDELENLGVRHRRGGNVQFFRGLGGQCRDGGKGGKQFFHRSVPSEVSGVRRFARPCCGYLREKCVTSLSPTLCRICTRTSSNTTVTIITSVWKRW